MKKQRRKTRRQFFFIVAGDQDDWPLTGAHLLAGFVDKNSIWSSSRNRSLGNLMSALSISSISSTGRLFGVKRLPQLRP